MGSHITRKQTLSINTIIKMNSHHYEQGIVNNVVNSYRKLPQPIHDDTSPPFPQKFEIVLKTLRMFKNLSKLWVTKF
jgi:hypothetical protein